MKNTVASLVSFFILLFAYTKFVGPIPFSVNQITTTKTDTFTVTGEGKVTAAPDMAVINAGVQTQGASVQQAQQELNKKINAVSDAVKKAGVDSKDIQTTNYNISPMYDFREQTQRITGYQANTNLTIKIRDINKANSVVDSTTNAGANTVGGISFEISDQTKAENEAREKAVSQARKKAEDAARIAGFTLGRIINYSESFGGFGPIPVMAKAERGVDAAPTRVEPGTNEIVVTVTLSFEIR